MSDSTPGWSEELPPPLPDSSPPPASKPAVPPSQAPDYYYPPPDAPPALPPPGSSSPPWGTVPAQYPPAAPGWAVPPPPPPPGYAAPPPYIAAPGHVPFERSGSPRPFAPPLAGWWRRALGYLIDIVIVFVAIVAVALVLHRDLVLAIVVAQLLQLSYIVLLLGNRGQTIGMMAVRVRLLDAKTGSPMIGYPRALVRTVAAFLIGLPYSLGVPFFILLPLFSMLWPIWDRSNQTWHDKIGGTVAVHE